MVADRDDLIRARHVAHLQRVWPEYSDVERDYYTSETNKMVEWHVKYWSLYELEKRTREWVEQKERIIIVLTDDHTLLLTP